jgi:hypothetical protein
MGTMFIVIGFVAGVPIGVVLEHLLLKAKNGCSVTNLGGERCRGARSKVCVDNLCAEHCKTIHDGKCVEILRS